MVLRYLTDAGATRPTRGFRPPGCNNVAKTCAPHDPARLGSSKRTWSNSKFLHELFPQDTSRVHGRMTKGKLQD